MSEKISFKPDEELDAQENNESNVPDHVDSKYVCRDLSNEGNNCGPCGDVCYDSAPSHAIHPDNLGYGPDNLPLVYCGLDADKEPCKEARRAIRNLAIEAEKSKK